MAMETSSVTSSRGAAVRKQLVLAGSALLAVMLASFAMLRLIPGDPARRIAGPNVGPEELEQIREGLGLDQPFLIQLRDYLAGVFTGDFGASFASQQDVGGIVADRLPKTLELAGAGFVLAVGIGIPLGLIVGALTRDGTRPALSHGFTGVTSLVQSIPDYLLAALLVLVLAVTLPIFPVAGAEGIDSLLLPAIAVSAGAGAILARVTRIETLAVLSADYVKAAQVKNLSTVRIYALHVLPNVMTASLTISGLILTSLIGGAVVVENVFAWPGLGTELVRAISQRDYPVVQAVVLMLGVVIVVVNLLVDLAISVFDPRSTIRDR